MADHLVQYLIEPILAYEQKFKFYAIRRKLSHLEVIGMIRKNIGFYPIQDMFDRIEVEKVQSDLMNQIQNRHSFRIQQLEKTIATLCDQMSKRERRQTIWTNMQEKITKKKQNDWCKCSWQMLTDYD